VGINAHRIAVKWYTTWCSFYRLSRL